MSFPTLIILAILGNLTSTVRLLWFLCPIDGISAFWVKSIPKGGRYKACVSFNNPTSVIFYLGAFQWCLLWQPSLIFFVERRNSMGLTDDEIVNVSYCYCLTIIPMSVTKEKNSAVREKKWFPVILPLCTRFRCWKTPKKDLILSLPSLFDTWRSRLRILNCLRAGSLFSQTREASRGSRAYPSTREPTLGLSIQVQELTFWVFSTWEVFWCLLCTIIFVPNTFFLLYSWFTRWWAKQAHPQASALLAAVQTHPIMEWIRSSHDASVRSNTRRSLSVFTQFSSSQFSKIENRHLSL